jgi:hypothetical protein
VAYVGENKYGYSTIFTTNPSIKLRLKTFHFYSSKIDEKFKIPFSTSWRWSYTVDNILSHRKGRHSGGGEPNAQPPAAL